jgi:hypothetical protein
MQIAQRRDIVNANGSAGKILDSYESGYQQAEKGFGLMFEGMAEVARFLVTLGSNAMYDEMNELSSRTDYTDPDTAKALADSCFMDALGDGVVLYFPGWELSES